MTLPHGFTLAQILPDRNHRVVEATCFAGHYCVGFVKKLHCPICAENREAYQPSDNAEWRKSYREVTYGAGV